MPCLSCKLRWTDNCVCVRDVRAAVAHRVRAAVALRVRAWCVRTAVALRVRAWCVRAAVALRVQRDMCKPINLRFVKNILKMIIIINNSNNIK